jgi:hypothetical protein
MQRENRTGGCGFNWKEAFSRPCGCAQLRAENGDKPLHVLAGGGTFRFVKGKS